MKLKRYFACEFWKFLYVRILTVIKIKNGFNISIGWKLKKYKFNQRLAPFTSTPIIGTIARKMKEIKKIGKTSLINNSVFINEIINIIDIAIIVKVKCLIKKK